MRSLEALSLFEALEPPPIVTARNGSSGGSRFIRLLGRKIDLSCHLGESNLIILAFAEEAPCPVPISIDGERVDGAGTVLLQWVHPLPVNVDQLVPPRQDFFDDEDVDSQAFHISPDSQLQGVAAAWR